MHSGQSMCVQSDGEIQHISPYTARSPCRPNTNAVVTGDINCTRTENCNRKYVPAQRVHPVGQILTPWSWGQRLNTHRKLQTNISPCTARSPCRPNTNAVVTGDINWTRKENCKQCWHNNRKSTEASAIPINVAPLSLLVQDPLTELLLARTPGQVVQVWQYNNGLPFGAPLGFRQAICGHAF